MRFQDREQAGQELSRKLRRYAHQPDVIILALPRGGVPVAYEIAMALNAPLDILNVRKLGVPEHEELAMGAITTGDVVVINHDIVRHEDVSDEAIDEVIQAESIELARREALYREGRPAPDLYDKTVLLVDDGLATGATMWAAVNGVRQQQPAKIVIAVPSASPSACAQFEAEVDEIVCLITPHQFVSVGAWYEDFPQTSDAEVRRLLKQAEERIVAG